MSDVLRFHPAAGPIRIEAISDVPVRVNVLSAPVSVHVLGTPGPRGRQGEQGPPGSQGPPGTLDTGVVLDGGNF